MRIFLIFSLILCALSDASAFSKENHRLITERAIELLQKKYGEDYLSEKEIEQIIKGNLSEESFNFKALIRPFNKHYFNPDKDSTLWQRNNSIDVRFERLVAEFYGQHGRAGFHRSIGEIIHFIQDAASPSHVVPIAHKEKKDRFDSQQISHLLPNELMEEKYLQCTAEYPQFLMEKLSRKTLEGLKGKFAVNIEVQGGKVQDSLSWSAFWQQSSTSWFGDYGFLGKSGNKATTDNFLQGEIETGGKIYHIHPSTYDTFTKHQLDLAVLYTARFIYFAKSLIDEDGEIVDEMEI